MNKILIKNNDERLEIAQVLDGTLENYKVFKRNNIISNVYSGKITQIVKKSFAFIDIGLEKNGFLDLNDSKEKLLYEYNGEKKKLKIKMGDQILVQVIKEGTKDKGVSLTTQINFTGDTMVVFKCIGREIGISKKITDDEKRNFLKEVAEGFEENYGIIFRTESMFKSADDLTKEFFRLKKNCDEMFDKGQYIKPPALVFTNKNHIIELVKSFNVSGDTKIIVENENVFEMFKNNPKYADKVELYDSTIDLFANEGLASKIYKLFQKKLWLKSGGFIYFETYEAGTFIDVNTGKSVNEKSRDKLAFKTNKEALVEILRNIKLRNISGIILIDFIDMKIPEHREELMEQLYTECKNNYPDITIHGMTSLGIVELTRKKTNESLSETVMEDCSYCNGTGKVLSPDFLHDKVFRQVFNILSGRIFNTIEVFASKKFIKYVNSNDVEFKNLEDIFNCTIKFIQLDNVSDDYFTIKKYKQ